MYANQLKPLAIGLVLVVIASAIGIYLMTRASADPISESEMLASRFPETIGNYERASDTAEQVQKRDECLPQDGGELCMTTLIAEYRQTDGNGVVFVHTARAADGDEAELRSFIASRARTGPSALPGTLRFERHELGWYAEGEYDFILTQEGVYAGNSVSYANQAQGTNPVTKYFLLTYPPTTAE